MATNQGHRSVQGLKPILQKANEGLDIEPITYGHGTIAILAFH